VPEKMKVGFLTGSVSRNGGGTFESLRGLGLAMHQLPELELRVFGLRDACTAIDLPAWEPVPVNVSATRGPKSFGYSAELVGAVRAAPLDLLHVHGLWMFTSIAARRWSRRTQAPYLVTPRGMLDRWALHHGRPYVVSPHGMLEGWALGHGRWKKRIASALYEFGHLRGAACLHALCEAELRSIREFGLSNPVCVIPNGVELARSQVAQQASWRAGIPERAKVLLYLGRLHPKKGLLNLLRAWTELCRKRPERTDHWYLVIAGWDQDGHQVELEASLSADITDNVRFIGPQFGADKEATLHSSDAFILPSLSEGLPMAVLEAWAHGLPVLMTPHCNIPEGFSANAALPMEPTPESIAGQLCALFAMPDEQRHAMGRNGRELVTARFSWPSVAAQLQAVYLWIGGMGPRPDCVHLT
jgi:glycosyltransferase involved in cell wall biosynthesis